jgi:hypothetical protein
VEILAWIEQTPVGLWVREAPTIWAFPFVLLLHTVGLGMVAGTAVMLNAYAIRRPQAWRAALLEPWFRFAWAGFAVNLVSGVLLLAAYPTKALTDPVFYVKIACVVVAMLELQWLRGRHGAQAADSSAGAGTSASAIRAAAIVAFVFWTAAVVTGRLLAYTYRYLMAADMPVS